MIFEDIRENDHVVDKNTVVFAIQLQCPVYEVLYVRKRVRIFYEYYLRSFNIFITDKDKSIAII